MKSVSFDSLSQSIEYFNEQARQKGFAIHFCLVPNNHGSCSGTLELYKQGILANSFVLKDHKDCNKADNIIRAIASLCDIHIPKSVYYKDFRDNMVSKMEIGTRVRVKRTKEIGTVHNYAVYKRNHGMDYTAVVVHIDSLNRCKTYNPTSLEVLYE